MAITIAENKTMITTTNKQLLLIENKSTMTLIATLRRLRKLKGVRIVNLVKKRVIGKVKKKEINIV